MAEVVDAEGELEAVLSRRPLVLAPVHPGVVDQDVDLDGYVIKNTPYTRTLACSRLRDIIH